MSSMQSAPPRHGHVVRPMHILILGSRASDGRSSTSEEIASRFVRDGHAVDVLDLDDPAAARRSGAPSLRRAALATSRLLLARRADVALVLDPADAPLLPLIRSRGTAVGLRIDDPNEPERGERRSEAVERMAVRGADALVASTLVDQDRILHDYAVPVEFIRTGTRIVTHSSSDRLGPLRLVPGGFHIATAGAGGEDRMGMILEGLHRSDARMPLVVLGPVTEDAKRLAERDSRIRLLGDLTDRSLLDQLHAHALSAVHAGTSSGSAGPLLRAMGAGTAVIARRSLANREIAGTAGSYFSSIAELTRDLEEVEQYPFRFRDLGELMQERAGRFHDWDVTAEQYSGLAAKLARGYSTRGMSSGRRVDRSAVENRHD